MSIDALNWAFRQKLPRSSEKLVLISLANYTNGNGTVWPSIGRLSYDTSQNRKTVINNIARLIDAGLLEDTGKRVGTTKSIPVYRFVGLCETKQSPKRNSSNGEAVPKLDGSSPVFTRKQSLKRDTEPLKEPLRNLYKASSSQIFVLKSKLEAVEKELDRFVKPVCLSEISRFRKLKAQAIKLNKDIIEAE